MSKNLNHQITNILARSQTRENAISSIDFLIVENKEFLEVRIKSLETLIIPLLSISLAPFTYFSISLLNAVSRKEYKKIFNDIHNSNNKIDLIYDHDGLNTLKLAIVPVAIASFHQATSWILQAVQYLAHDPELLEDASKTIECLNSLNSSDNMIEICGNNGSYYLSE